MATEEYYQHQSQPQDDLTALLQNIEYAARGVDERHDRIIERQWRTLDQTINGTMANIQYQTELLKNVPFRKTEPGNG